MYSKCKFQLSLSSTKLEFVCVLAVVFVIPVIKDTGSYSKRSFKSRYMV